MAQNNAAVGWHWQKNPMKLLKVGCPLPLHCTWQRRKNWQPNSNLSIGLISHQLTKVRCATHLWTQIRNIGIIYQTNQRLKYPPNYGANRLAHDTTDASPFNSDLWKQPNLLYTQYLLLRWEKAENDTKRDASVSPLKMCCVKNKYIYGHKCRCVTWTYYRKSVSHRQRHQWEVTLFRLREGLNRVNKYCILYFREQVRTWSVSHLRYV